jgi:iron complex transport system permease protein
LGFAFAALGALVISLQSAEYELGFALLAFSMGSVSGKGLHHLFMALPLVIAGVLAAIAWGRQLDLLLTGEEEARALGLRLDQVRRWVIVWIAVLVAAAVAVGGNIAFVGLVVPHLIRRMCGPLHRGLVPVAALGGAVFVVACDWLARSWPGHGELPLGVVTGLVGAPLFLVLLLRRRGAAFA